MRRTAQIVAAAAAALAIGTSSEACGRHQTPRQRLAEDHSDGRISAVALVRITGAGYTHAPSSGPWRASAKVERLHRGSYPGRTLSFSRGWGQAACDDGLPPPRAGELWVVYFWKRAPGDQRVRLTYPARIAFAADPTLGPAPR